MVGLLRATFDPASYTGLIVDFDAAFGVTLVSSAVSDWAPRAFLSGYGNHAVQATAGKRPTVSNINGRSALAFVLATPQCLATTAWTGAALVQPFTCYQVLQCTSTTASQVMCDGISAINRLVWAANDGAANRLTLYAGGTFNSSPTDVNTGPCVIAGVVSGSAGASKIYKNGTLQNSGNAGTQVPTGFTFGALFTQLTNGFTGTLARHILFQGAHPQSLVSSISNGLRRLYGMSP